MIAYIGLFKDGELITKITNSIDFYYKKEYINAMEHLCYLYSDFLKGSLEDGVYVAWGFYTK